MPDLITDDQMRELEALATEHLNQPVEIVARLSLSRDAAIIRLARSVPALLHQIAMSRQSEAALSDEVEQLRDGIAELERQLNAEAKHAALGPDECCDVCTHRQAEDMIAEVERLEAASVHEREITDKAITSAGKAEAALERVRQVLAEHPGSAWDSGIKLQAALKAALDGE